MYAEIGIIVALVMANGLFAMAEIAVVSARPTRLRQMADAGSAGARAALRLVESPGPFLATIQIGITLVGVLSGAYGEATLARHLEPALESVPLLSRHSEGAAGAIVVLGITYLTLVFGELTPKSLALAHSDAIATRVAIPMQLLGRFSAPAVWVLNRSAQTLSRLLAGDRAGAETVSREEIEMLVAQWSQEGAIDEAEAEMARGLLDLGDRPIEGMVTPRPDVVWLDANADPDEVRAFLVEHPHTVFPVADGSLDRAIGTVRARELLVALLQGEPLEVRARMAPLLSVPARLSALSLLKQFGEHRTHMALVLDDYGGLMGVITLTDLMQTIVRGVAVLDPKYGLEVVRVSDRAWSVDGMMAVEDFAEEFDVEVADDDRAGYVTVAGLILHLMGALPSEGDEVTYRSLRLRAERVDDRRIVRVIVEQPERNDDDAPCA